MKQKVLAIGEDEMLLLSRIMALSARGYDATSYLHQDACHLLASQAYDLLLVCSSMPVASVLELISESKRRRPHTPILRLVHQASPAILTGTPCEVVKIDHHPMTWMSAVDRLLSRDLAA